MAVRCDHRRESRADRSRPMHGCSAGSIRSRSRRSGPGWRPAPEIPQGGPFAFSPPAARPGWACALAMAVRRNCPESWVADRASPRARRRAGSAPRSAPTAPRSVPPGPAQARSAVLEIGSQAHHDTSSDTDPLRRSCLLRGSHWRRGKPGTANRIGEVRLRSTNREGSDWQGGEQLLLSHLSPEAKLRHAAQRG